MRRISHCCKNRWTKRPKKWISTRGNCKSKRACPNRAWPGSADSKENWKLLKTEPTRPRAIWLWSVQNTAVSSPPPACPVLRCTSSRRRGLTYKNATTIDTPPFATSNVTLSSLETYVIRLIVTEISFRIFLFVTYQHYINNLQHPLHKF